MAGTSAGGFERVENACETRVVMRIRDGFVEKVGERYQFNKWGTTPLVQFNCTCVQALQGTFATKVSAS